MKFWYRPNFLAVFAIIILSLLSLKSLSAPGFYTNHDGETHTARIAQYYQAVKDGQIPPRLAGSFYNGLGSPIFVYLYPMPYILGSIVHQIGFSFGDSFKMIMALGFIFSGIFSYLWLKEVFKNVKAAFLGALFYIWLPYRFLLLYVRGSISELLAYTFLPLTLFALTRLGREKNLKWTAISSISFSLLLLSQNLVAIISTPIIVLYILTVTLNLRSFVFLKQAVTALFWGFAIASFTYLPALFERNYIRFDEVFAHPYVDHFVTLKQLIRSPWGYGFDLPGTVNDQISFQVGLAHIFILLLSLPLVIFSISRLFPQKNWLSLVEERFPEILNLFFISIFVTSVFLMLKFQPTTIVWEKIKFLQIIDLPWRFLGITGLATAFISAYTVKKIKAGVFFIFLIVFVLLANRNHLRINQARFLDDNFFENYTGTATQYNEFTPKWRQTTRVPVGFDPKVPAQINSGEAQIENLKFKSNQISFSVQVFSPTAQIQINKFYFPAWQIITDGQKLQLNKDIIITDSTNDKINIGKDNSGLMAINLLFGSHQISAKYSETKLRTFANLLAFGSFSIVVTILIKSYAKSSRLS